MKEKFIKIIAILGCILPLAAIGNAPINKDAEFEVPYEFVVRDRVFPAGKYILRSANDQKTAWTLTGKSATERPVFMLVNTVEAIDRIDIAKLTFRQYGDRYFLAGFTALDYRVTLPKTGEERSFEREFSAADKPVRTEIVMNKAIRQPK